MPFSESRSEGAPHLSPRRRLARALLILAGEYPILERSALEVRRQPNIRRCHDRTLESMGSRESPSRINQHALSHRRERGHPARSQRSPQIRTRGVRCSIVDSSCSPSADSSSSARQTRGLKNEASFASLRPGRPRERPTTILGIPRVLCQWDPPAKTEWAATGSSSRAEAAAVGRAGATATPTRAPGASGPAGAADRAGAQNPKTTVTRVGRTRPTIAVSRSSSKAVGRTPRGARARPTYLLVIDDAGRAAPVVTQEWAQAHRRHRAPLGRPCCRADGPSDRASRQLNSPRMYSCVCFSRGAPKICAVRPYSTR